ncbi:MAG TPA: cytochrome o ubiquinol oxidase subunit III [Candidatus Paceibacterota bacterium]|nr:cytochrome o ubiquinol oxidase subunit III [Candidatus Paceibacterota bacterium]
MMTTNAAHRTDSAPVFGFWLYLMSDCLLFAALFATYAVLRTNTFGGPDADALFNLPYALVETLILLTSSFVAGLGMVAASRGSKTGTLSAFIIALLLGLAFLGLEVHEFAGLIAAGAGPSRSAFLSSYFALVGTHGLHVALGSFWMILALVHTAKSGLHQDTMRRLTLVSMFWHFLDIIWIFIFTFVYIFGSI